MRPRLVVNHEGYGALWSGHTGRYANSRNGFTELFIRSLVNEGAAGKCIVAETPRKVVLDIGLCD